MFRRLKVVDVEWTETLTDLEGLHAYDAVHALIRLNGRPAAQVTVPVRDGSCTANALRAAVVEQHGDLLDRHEQKIAADRALEPAAMLAVSAGVSSSESADLPLITVAVCTRARPIELRRCLESLSRLDYPSLEVLVVDNAPTSDATELVVRDFAEARYVREPRPGLNWARNRAIVEARGEIIGYIDDDALADARWAAAVASVFRTNDDVMAVTGLVLPQTLETEAQVFFEQYGGFGCGFQRRRFDWRNRHHAQWRGQMMECGTGANMAFRRSVFERIGPFDPALDVGTPTAGGGDIEMFFRLLKRGGMLVYEPAALVRHEHRRDYAGLRSQIESWGSGTVAVLARSAAAFPDERARLIRLGLRGLLRQAGRFLSSLARPPGYPRALLFAELKGTVRGFGLYRRSRRLAVAIERSHGPLLREPQA